MKQTSLIINVVLGLGLAVLYILHFSGNSNNPEQKTDDSQETIATLPAAGGNIAYINIDSVFTNSEMYLDLMQK